MAVVDFVPLFEVKFTKSPFTIEIVEQNLFDFDVSADANTLFTLELDPVEQFSLETGDNNTEFTLEIGAHTANNIGNNAVASATLDVIITSAIALSLYRAVTGDGVYCEPSVPSLERYAGVTKVAVGPGLDVSLIRAGKLIDLGWSWTPDSPIFVGVSGVLTQISTSAPVRRIGWAISATQINFDPFPTIGV